LVTTTGLSVTGGNDGEGDTNIGGLVGINDVGAIVRYSRAGGSVENRSAFNVVAGGLVGLNLGEITESRADVNVAIVSSDEFFIFGQADVGGLVGSNSSGNVLRDVAATGDVRAVANGVSAGGLVGRNNGPILRAYASGSVTGSATGSGFTDVGGLVGLNLDSITQGLATGAVSEDAEFPALGTTFIGGLIGSSDTSFDVVVGSFWDTQATGQIDADGGGFSYPGAQGLTTSALQDFAGFLGTAGAAGWSFTEHWSPSEPGTYARLYAIDNVVWVDPENAEVEYGFDPADFPGLIDFESYGGPAFYVFDPLFEPESDQQPEVTFAQPSSLDVGTYAIEVAGVRSVFPNPDTAQDYEAVTSPATFAILPRRLTITAQDQQKVYGDTAGLGTTAFMVEGLVTTATYSDAVTGVTLSSAGAAATAPVVAGGYDIVPSNPQGSGLSNYIIDADSFVPGTLTVLRAPLTITADDRLKFFGEALNLGTTAFTVSGLRNQDTVDAVLLFSAGAPADAPVEGSPYPILSDGEAGTGLGNYDITFVPGQLVVLPVDDGPPSIPPPTFTLPNPPDTITNLDLPDRSTDATPVAGARSQAVADAEQVLALMDALATELELAAQACRQETPLGTELLDCIANALGAYASALEELTLDLPPELAQVSAVIRQAQIDVQGVRSRAEARLATATTDAERREIERQAVEEAIGVVQGAAGEVRRAIELIRADDPQLVSVFSDQGATVVRALESVEIELVRAIGI
jgi:hypothetical protein